MGEGAADIAELQQGPAHADARLVGGDALLVGPGVDPGLELALRPLAVAEVPGERAGNGRRNGYKPGSPSSSVKVATSAWSASASSTRPRHPRARRRGDRLHLAPPVADLLEQQARLTRARSIATVGRPVHIATFARSTPIIPFAQRSADSEPSRRTSDASCSASASWPWLNRTQARSPSAQESPPQSPISANTAADWLMRSSASSGRPRERDPREVLQRPCLAAALGNRPERRQGLLDCRFGVVELAPEHERHAPAS